MEKAPHRLCEFRAVHIDGAAQNVKRAIFHKVTVIDRKLLHDFYGKFR